MTDTKHVAEGSDLRTSVLQNLGGAVLLIASVSGMFWAIGLVGSADDEPLAAADATEEPQQEQVEVGPADADADAADADAQPEPDDGSPPPEPAPQDVAPEPEPEPDEQDESPQPEAEPEEVSPEPDPEPEPEPVAPSIPPGDISVQVLDGYQADGGSAASVVATQLADAGYRIVARNPAIRYDVTAVLWTPGNEAAGRQVAAAIGAAEVREQPGNLSTAVAVHVVVGADRG